MSKKVFIISSVILVIIAVWYGTLIGWFEVTNPVKTYKSDDVCYLNSAVTLLETGRFTRWNPENSSVHMMPGMTFLLLPFVAMFGSVSAVAAFKVFQITVHIFCIYMVGLIAFRAFGQRVSSVAMLIYAGYIPNAIMANLLIYENSLIALFLALVYSTIIAFDRRELKQWILPAILWTLSVYLRPMMAVYPLGVLILFFANKYDWKEIVKITVTVAVVFSVLMSPWWIRNAVTFHRFIPFTLASGNPMLLGVTPDYIKDDFSTEELPSGHPSSWQYIHYKYDEIETDAREYEEAISKIRAYFKEDFWGALNWFTFQKMIYQWLTPHFVGNPDFGVKVHWLTTPALFEHLMLVYLGLFGMIKGLFDKRTISSLLLLLTVVVYQTVNVVYHPAGRYMYPLMGFVIITASYFLAEKTYSVRECVIRRSRTNV